MASLLLFQVSIGLGGVHTRRAEVGVKEKLVFACVVRRAL